MNILLRHEIIISIKIRYIPLTAGGNANLSIWQYSYTMKLISLRENPNLCKEAHTKIITSGKGNTMTP